MNDDRTFVDTNVFVSAVDRHAARKRARAQTLLLTLGSSIVLSTQVLQEFFVTATRKLPVPLSAQEAEQRVDELSRLDVVVIDIPLVRVAISSSREHKLSLWDALVVAAAEARGCARLLSEDLQDGRQFGRVRVENPFKLLS